MKRILLLLMLAMLCLYFMYMRSNAKHELPGGFKRNFLTSRAEVKNAKDLEKKYYQIVSLKQADITICEYKTPYNIIWFSDDLNKRADITLPIFDSANQTFGGLTSVTLLDSLIVVLNGQSRKCYRGSKNLAGWTSKILDSVPFHKSIALNENSFIVRSQMVIDSQKLRKVKKIDWRNNELASFIPHKQADNYFSNDGSLEYDRTTDKLFYLYFYRGNFHCLDTNLATLYNASTIDTIGQAKIELAMVNNRRTLSTPPNLVNKRFCLANNRIYVNSAIMAENERLSEFRASNVIDVYNQDNGAYLYSFYLPKYLNRTLIEFKVSARNIVALYDYKIVIYSLPKESEATG